MSDRESKALEVCRKLIEKRLGWGDTSDWRNDEFESLSREIMAKTGVNLSHTTLKRIWGRVKYDHLPTTTTLNALAVFLDFESWRDFKIRQGTEKRKNRAISWSSRTTRWWAFGLLSMVVIGLFVTTRDITEVNHIAGFSAKYVSEGVPNSVVFSFDISKVDGKEFFLQQSWDPGKRVSIRTDQVNATTTYYLPGYFHAKLVADDRIVEETDVYIESGGWIATINKDPVPEYLMGEDFLTNEGTMRLSIQKAAELISEGNPDVQGFHLYGPQLGVDGTEFSFDARLRNTYHSGAAVCGMTNVVLQFTDGFVIIPLSIPGCIGELSLIVFDERRAGDKSDLSVFGCDIYNWQELSFRNKKDTTTITLNGEKVFSLPLTIDPGKLAGIRFNFVGTGEVDFVSIRNNENEAVYHNRFGD